MPRPQASSLLLTLSLWSSPGLGQAPGTASPKLAFPGLLAQAARLEGNPLATLATMRKQEKEYLASRIFAGIYPEVRLNYEQFLGVPDAGPRAMQLPQLRARYRPADPAVLSGYTPHSAVDVICKAATKTRLVIFGEEHHLPQTRSLYRSLVERLHALGYRYLAAETFTPAVMEKDFAIPDYRAGYYLMDPVFACAVRRAVELGYTLVAYDTSERGPAGDASFRDRKQAETIHARTFARDPKAKVLVLAGRGHAAEVPPQDGWTPMASVLKKRSGIDPFTVYAPTMSARLDADSEHPLYRHACARGQLDRPVIYVDAGGTPFAAPNCDAYLFWPRPELREGRPDWLRRELGRRDVAIPEALRVGEGLRLVQVFGQEDRMDRIPIDQVLLEPGRPEPVLVLPKGAFRARVLGPAGQLGGPVPLRVD